MITYDPIPIGLAVNEQFDRIKTAEKFGSKVVRASFYVETPDGDKWKVTVQRSDGK